MSDRTSGALILIKQLAAPMVANKAAWEEAQSQDEPWSACRYIVAEGVSAGMKPGAYATNAYPKTLRGFFTGLATLANAGHANAL